MPLLIAALKASPGLPGAGSNGEQPNAAAVAQVWATAVESWAAGIVPPSTTVTAAKATLQSALAGLFAVQRGQASELPALASALESAHLAFATTVGGGMAAGGYAATPPVGQVGFAAILSAPPRDSSQLAANAIADALDVWMRTGIAVMVAPPFTSVPWS